MDHGATSIEELEWEKLGPYAADPELQRLQYVIDRLQEADELESDLTWGSDIAEGVTVEELLGALGEAMHLIDYVDELEEQVVELHHEKNRQRLHSTMQRLNDN